MRPQVELEFAEAFRAIDCDEQKRRLHALERVIEGGLRSFLEVGKALLQIRDEQLFRPLYATFGDYLVKRWGVTFTQGASLMRSTLVAEILLAGPAAPGGDAPLTVDLAESTLRPLQKLSPELQCACWRLASRITEKPTAHIVSRIVRTVTAAIEQGQANGSHTSNGCGSEVKRAQKAIFLAAVHRLAAGESFSAQIIALRIGDAVQAKRFSTSCKILINRCEAILRELQRRFPQL
jgi:hypothetical protein